MLTSRATWRKVSLSNKNRRIDLLKRFMPIPLIIFLFFIAPKIVLSQSNPETLFDQGLSFYQNEDFVQAKASFKSLLAISQNNKRETIGLILLAKSCFNLGEYDAAIRHTGEFIRKYPSSSYIAHAYYERAKAYLKKNNANEAFDNFAFTLEFSRSNELRRLAETAGTALVDNTISLRKMDELLAAYPWISAKPMLTIWLAHLKYKSGKTTEANTILNDFLASKPADRYATIAQQLMKKDISAEKPQVRVGVLQPMSGYFSEEANDFMRGVAFALKRRKANATDISLVIKDTQGDIVETINSALAIKDADVELVITGLEGSNSAAAAGLLQTSNIPVIIPVSTDNRLTEIGDNIFQFNNDVETRGAALAEYAMTKMNLRSFATLAPADEYGNAITDAFANKVDELGGSIVSQQWYYPGTEDFSGQLEALREASFRHAFRDSLRTWGETGTMERVDAMYNQRDRQARRASEDNYQLAKYTDVAARAIDGFFAPIYEEDIPFIAPQFSLYNIKSALLGGDTWNNPELLRRHQRDVNGVVYVSGYYISETDLDVISFVRDFRVATATSPGVLARYGYNVMNLIIDAVDAGNTKAADIAEYLKQTKEFEGLGTKISLDNKNRVNKYVNILQFQDGLIQRINE
jgi:branched-chain amino acid transport system substrate-binding protein